jgi:hypothetical protein
MGFDKEERENLYMLVISVQSVSVLACLVVILLYIWLKDLQQFTFKLVVYLAASDIVKGCAMFLSAENATSCFIQGILIVYFQLVSILWVGVISYVLYTVVVNGNFGVKHKERQFVLLCTLLPLCACILPIPFHKYGYSQGFCFVEDSRSDLLLEALLRAVVIYIPLYSVFAYVFFTYHRVFTVIHKNSAKDSSADADAYIYKLYLYPVVLVGCYLPFTVYRIYSFIMMGQTSYSFAFASVFFLCLSGLCNALAYGLNKHVRSAVVQKWRRYWHSSHYLTIASTLNEERNDIQS